MLPEREREELHGVRADSGFLEAARVHVDKQVNERNPLRPLEGLPPAALRRDKGSCRNERATKLSERANTETTDQVRKVGWWVLNSDHNGGDSAEEEAKSSFCAAFEEVPRRNLRAAFFVDDGANGQNVLVARPLGQTSEGLMA